MMSRRAFLSGLSVLALPPSVNLREKALRLMVDRLDASTRDEGPKLTLREFVEQAWPILRPGEAFVGNWHIDVICEHLQGVTAGHITHLLINVPPGTMKSLLVNVFWPAWEWTLDPSLKYLTASYDQELSTRNNADMRTIVESEWYQRNWPHVQMKDDQNQKTRYETTRAGWRIGTSVGGKGTGWHPNRKIVDDPHNVKKSASKTDRETVINWFTKTLANRGYALGAATVVIMQRLHEEDVSGWILKNQADTYVHLMLPMRFEPDRQCSTFGSCTATVATDTAGHQTLTFGAPQQWTDPRTQKGELLWPHFLTPTIVASTARTLGTYGDAGQNQQRPTPEEGGMFKLQWFTKRVDAVPADAHILARALGIDCAATEGGGDHSAFVQMCITTDGRVFVERVTRGQWGPQSFEGPGGMFHLTCTSAPAWTRIREEEEGGSSGKKVTAAHAQLLMGYDYQGVRSTGDKATRARPFAAQCAVGNVYLVNGPWVDAYVDELTHFRPDGSDQVDDQVDASATAFNEIALNNLVAGTMPIEGY